MRVAFLNREPSAYVGGDVLSINETIDALCTLGVEATYLHGQWTPADLAPFDLVHVKHVNFGWSKFNFEQVWASGRPYVVQPVFYPRTDLGMNAEDITNALVRAHAVIPYTWAEWLSLEETTGLNQDIMSVDIMRVQCIPNGTSATFHHPAHGMRLIDVLCVSAREGKGNTAMVESVCRRNGWSFRNVTGVPYSDMPQHYRDAKVYVSATDGDRMSRTVGEALCSGCRVISSTADWGGGVWYPGLVTFEHTDETQLEASIRRALEPHAAWDWTPNFAARLLTWETVALLLRAVYLEALG